MIYLFENARQRTMQWWPLQLILETSKPNQTKQHIFTPTYYTFLKITHQGQCNGDLCSWFGWPPNQTKPNTANLPLHDIPFLKTPDQGHCNGDLCSWFRWPPNQTKPNNAYLPLHDIPFWKCQTKHIAMVTSAADLGDIQTKPNQIMHIYLYMIYLLETHSSFCWSTSCKLDRFLEHNALL